jgi:transcriptional regulator with GAF, ATPase, and Fis domain
MGQEEQALAKIKANAEAQTKKLVRDSLEKVGWSLTAAARLLGVKPSSLQTLIGTVGLADEYREKARPRGRPRVDRPWKP